MARRDPKARLGCALVKADEMRDGDLKYQVILVDRDAGTLRALDIRLCGRTGMTATDVSTGKTERISVRAVWALNEVAK